MKVIITHYSDTNNLAVLLTLLQAQLVPPKEVIVIDTSPKKTGLEICQRFNANNINIKVECARVNIYEAWNRGIDLANGDDVVILNDDLLIPLNFIDVLELVSINTRAYCFIPDTPNKSHYKDKVDREFSYYARIPETIGDISVSPWMPGFCFMLKKECIRDVGLFNEKHYKVWYGDDDYQERIKKVAIKNNVLGIVKINSMFVYHYGGKSYKYQNKEVQKLINKDRKSYAKKYLKKN